eukprot:UN08925
MYLQRQHVVSTVTTVPQQDYTHNQQQQQTQQQQQQQQQQEQYSQLNTFTKFQTPEERLQLLLKSPEALRVADLRLWLHNISKCKRTN